MNKTLFVGMIVGAGASVGVAALGSLAFMDGNHQAKPPTLTAAHVPAPVTDEPHPGNTGEEIVAPAPAAELSEAAAPVALTPPVGKSVRTEPKYARVVSVEPVTRTVSEPREVCQDVEVVKQAPTRDEHQVAGTVIGGVIGGVLGNQIGDGDGRKIAKVAGVIGGAYAGNKVQERIQSSRTVKTVETKCETVYDSREVQDGFRVTYEWNGSTETVNMASDPGSRLPVRKGEVVLTANTR